MKTPVDLRSDTVTKPTPAMRRAMAEAEVGDDVLGEDPTIRQLEETTARLLGKEESVFVPSGTMGNEIALRVHARPGHEVIVEEYCHIMNAEGGAPAALSGLTLRAMASRGGQLDPALVESMIHSDQDWHHAPTALVCIENTHNRHGGIVYPPAEVDALSKMCRARGLALHMDGARLWNAATALERPPAELTQSVDTVMVCYSKGLGAPVGSALAGSREAIQKARRERKRFGGGMRQAGILAAGCLHALEHHLPRVGEDHRRARRLVEIASPPGDVRVLGGMPQTNIVIFTLPDRLDVFKVIEKLRGRGILMSHFGPGILRAITHLDVDDEQIEAAGRAIHDVLAIPVTAASPGAA